MHKKFKTKLVLSLLFAGVLAAHCRAELKPDEIAIIAAAGDRDSQGLAKYYVRVRGVPADNICSVEMPKGEVCPPETWRAAIRPAVRKWLQEHDPQQKIKCLVTV